MGAPRVRGPGRNARRGASGCVRARDRGRLVCDGGGSDVGLPVAGRCCSGARATCCSRSSSRLRSCSRPWYVGSVARSDISVVASPLSASLRCVVATSRAGSGAPLALLLLGRKGGDPVHPRVTGAAIGVVSGAWAAVLIDLHFASAWISRTSRWVTSCRWWSWRWSEARLGGRGSARGRGSRDRVGHAPRLSHAVRDAHAVVAAARGEEAWERSEALVDLRHSVEVSDEWLRARAHEAVDARQDRLKPLALIRAAISAFAIASSA